MSFPSRLSRSVEQRESQIVLGLDPNPAQLWPSSSDSPTSDTVSSAVADHCRRAIDAVGESCVAIKPQLACFERLGSSGWQALETVVTHAQAAGLLVIADGKRGDVPVTATAYREALVEALGADAFTVNPLLGVDSLEPYVEATETDNVGVFVLVRTSNPGSADFEDLELASGERLWERVAMTVNALGGVAPDGPLAPIGAVMGATYPEHLVRARELMPRAIFLLPGVGAQGGKVEDLAPAFEPHKAAGLVTASRGIVNAYLDSGSDPATAAKSEAERLRELAWTIGS